MKGHPLFPCEEDDDDRDISWIRITRCDSGTWMWVPQRYPADRIMSLEDIHGMFGGGFYELIAKDVNDRYITHRQRYHIPGTSLPLIAGSEGAAPVASMSANPTVSGPTYTVTPPTPPQPSIDTNIIGLMMQMQQQSMQMMMQMSQQQTQMMTAFVAASKQDAHSLIESMSKHSEAMANSQGQFYSAMIAGVQGRQSAPLDQAKDFLSLGLKLGQSAEPVKVDNSADLMSSLGSVMDVFKTMASSPIAPPSPPPPLPDMSSFAPPPMPTPTPTPEPAPVNSPIRNEAISLTS